MCHRIYRNINEFVYVVSFQISSLFGYNLKIMKLKKNIHNTS